VFAANLIRIEAERREQAGQWDEAATLRRDVIAQPAVVDSDFVVLGDALSKAGKHTDAIEAYRVAVMRNPEPDTYRSLIREYVAAGRAAEADSIRAEYERIKRERFLER